MKQNQKEKLGENQEESKGKDEEKEETEEVCTYKNILLFRNFRQG